jgi:hypothetical protein
MALLEGKTPETIAKEIVKSLEDQAVMISGMAFEDVTFLVRSKNIATIEARGEKYWESQKDNLFKAFLSDVIHNLAVAKKNYLVDQEVKAQDSLFRLLCSRGVHPAEAVKTAYPDGVPKPRK